jgi:hypothetical protein
VLDLDALPIIEPDDDTPCGVCVECGRGPFVIIAEPEPKKARCPMCRGRLKLRPDVTYQPGMQVASPPLIEPGSLAWEAILDLRRGIPDQDQTTAPEVPFINGYY